MAKSRVHPEPGRRVGAKIKHLKAEGKPQKEAVATALEMERRGRLGPKGGYKKKAS